MQQHMMQQQQQQQQQQSFDSLGPLPPHWEQSVTPEGEVYFINHATKDTTWFDPRIPILNQKVPIRQVEQCRQDDRLQKLENEKRELQEKRRLNELKKKQLERGRSQSQENMQAAMNQTQEMLMRHSLMESNNGQPQQPNSANGDPFLAAAHAAAVQKQELHNRQESADSGVGGMGSNFNLGSIPEDIPVEMDTTDLDTTLTATPTPNTPSDQTPGGMDQSDQLMPSLPAELGEVLNSDIDIMQEVLGSNRSTTWL